MHAWRTYSPLFRVTQIWYLECDDGERSKVLDANMVLCMCQPGQCVKFSQVNTLDARYFIFLA
jgi:hypothetical protein